MEVIRFMQTYLAFYLKGEIRLEDNFINLKVPNSFLSFIPLGFRTDAIPVNQITSISKDIYVDTATCVISIISLVIALMQLLMGYSPLSTKLIGLGFLLIAIIFFTNALRFKVLIRTTSGELKRFSCSIFEKKKVDYAIEEIKKRVADRMDDTNLRKVSQI